MILPTELIKTRGVNSHGAVVTIVESVPFDSVGFTTFHAVGEEIQNDVFDAVAVCDWPSLVDWGWWSILVIISTSAPLTFLILSAILTGIGVC